LGNKIGVKPSDKNAYKGNIRMQSLIDDLIREIDALKKRVTELES
tara:strand:+ start:2935 stop:3069 length:135 start_codon:yes stop_codon:yes gene_type:complete